jgi:enoyl-CoA hydratase/carnithine racemase
VASDDTIRAVVLTGAGEEAFCAGADLGADAFAFDYATPTSAYADLLRTARTLNVPLIARVNGACMAGGIGLLAMCDLAIAARHAIFGLPEAKVGVFPMQVLAVLQAQVPQRCLTQLCLTGDPIEAERAREIGLVNEVADELDAALERLLSRVLSNSPTALRRGLYAMKAMRSMTFEEAIAFGEGQIGLLAMTQDSARARRIQGKEETAMDGK